MAWRLQGNPCLTLETNMIVSLLYPSYPCFNWKIARGWWACLVTQVPATPAWDLSLDPHRQISRARWLASLVNPRWAVGHWETMSQNTWWEAVEDALCHLQTHASACTCFHMPYHAHTTQWTAMVIVEIVALVFYGLSFEGAPTESSYVPWVITEWNICISPRQFC